MGGSINPEHVGKFNFASLGLGQRGGFLAHFLTGFVGGCFRRGRNGNVFVFAQESQQFMGGGLPGFAKRRMRMPFGRNR